jgi:hypothetical protein
MSELGIDFHSNPPRRAAAGADRRCCKEVRKLATLLGRAAIARPTRFQPPVLCPRRALQCCCTTGRQCCSFTTRLGRSRRENRIVWRRCRSWMPYTGHSYIKLHELIQATHIVAAGIMVSYIMKRSRIAAHV